MTIDLCSRSEDGIRSRLDVKPPLKLQRECINHQWEDSNNTPH